MATTFTTSTNGTILVIDGITYQYSSADNSWTRIAQPLNGTSSTFTVTNITNAISTNTGAFQVRGGAGIGGSLYVGKEIYENGARVLTTASVNQFANQTSITAGTDTAVSTSTGAITIWNTSTLQSVTGRGATTTNIVSFTNTSSSTSTTTGAVVVTGGVGIGGDLNVGGTVTSNKLLSNTGSFANLNISATTPSINVTTGALTVAGGVGIGGNLNVSGTFSATAVLINGQSVGYGYSGSAGPQGPVGYAGSASTVSGPQGPTGFTGSGGYLGSSGATGYTGSIGAIGYSGSRGYDGSQGARGYCGSNGYWGSIGATGYTGSRGNAGTSVVILGSVATAAALPGYPSSYTGAIGDGYIVTSTGHLFVWTGTSWSDVGLIVGPQGPLGYTGSQGATGPQGVLGFTGSGGYLGSSGATGYTGSKGDLGYSGSTGYTGSQGPGGYWGSVGAQGPQGYTGSTGTQGVTGYTGSVGVTTGTTSTFIILNTTSSTSTNTGALQVRGGAGIAGDLWIGGNIYGPGGQAIGSNSTGTTSTFVILNTTSSTSTTTGALQVRGGAGIGGDLYVGGTIYGSIAGQTAGASTTGTTSTFVILNTTSSTSTNTGALQVRGGAGIGGCVNIGGSVTIGNTASFGSITGVSSIVVANITVTGSLNAPNLTYNSGTFQSQVFITNTSSSTSTTTGALVVTGGVGIGENLNVGGVVTVGNTASSGSITGVSSICAQNVTVTGNLTAPNLTFTSGTFKTPVVVSNTASSTSTQSGAVIVTGGLGVGGAVYASSFVTQGGLGSISGVAYITTLNLTATNSILVSGTINSTSTNSGALVVTGGAGIGGDLYVGGNVYGSNGQVIGAASTGTTSTFVILNTTSSTSTNTGALQVRGGAGIGGDLWIGGNIYGPGGQTIGSNSTGTTSTFVILNTTSSTSTTTGALQVRGGVGIGGAVYIGTASYIAGAQIITTASIGLYAAASAASTGTTSTFLVANITASTSTNTGALQVYGGVGIGGNVNIGGTVTGGGIRTTSTSTAPTNPTAGDIWYDTATDDVYRYTTDGTGFYWLDITGPTVSNSVTYQSINVYANLFNGSSQYLSVPTNAAFQFTTVNFTIEFWVNFTSVASGQNILNAYNSSASNINYAIYTNVTGRLDYLLSSDGSTWNLANAAIGSISVGQWYHVALVRNGNVFTPYLNGVAGTPTTSASAIFTNSNPVYIGAAVGSSGGIQFVNGSISNLRIIKGTALYTAAFTVPTAPLTAITNTSLLTCQTIPPADASTNNFAVTSVGGVGLSILSAQQSAAVVGPIILPDSTQFITANSLGMRNRVINGAMAIDQRNSGAAQTITAAAALAYTVDRWYAYSTGANVTGQRVAGTGTLQYVYQFTGAASTTAIGFAQRIEAVNSYDLNGSTVTLSAYLANSLLTTVTWTAYYATSADTFGTLASPTRTQIATGSWTVTSTLARYATNITIPAAATTGIEIVFTVGAQISGTWSIGAVQLEAGSVATPFERRPVGTELQLCQRYYCVLLVQGGFFAAGSLASDGTGPYYQAPFSYPVTMKSSPILTTSGFSNLGTSAYYRALGGYTSNNLGAAMMVGVSGGNGCAFYANVQASAEL
jgi:hypothetical protein